MDISSNYDMNSNHTSKEVKIIAFLLATCKKKIYLSQSKHSTREWKKNKNLKKDTLQIK